MKNTSQSRIRPNGFTLIELLVVIAIIGILTVILIPAVSSVRKKMQAAESVSNLRQIGVAAMAHSVENRGRFPSAQWNAEDGWTKVLYQYVYDVPYQPGNWDVTPLTGTIFWSPVITESYEVWGKSTYAYNWRMRDRSGQERGEQTAPDGPLALELMEPSRTVMVADCNNGKAVLYYETMGFHNPSDKANVLFFDGHVQSLELTEVPEDRNDIFWLGKYK
ncbi:MAG: prepilin-type N-terminal cleavage/methylation domain-containing protein [Opitutaceae bacterium]